MTFSSVRGAIAALLFASATMLLGCGGAPEIVVDYDQDADFSSYSSFAWVGDEASEVTGALPVPDLVLEEIKTAIENELLAKGYVRAQGLSEADFAVSFTVGATTQIEPHIVSGFFAESENNWQWGREYFEPGQVGQTATRVAYMAVTTGELAMTVFDVDERRPVWRAVGARVLTNQEISGEEAVIQKDVKVLLDEFRERRD